MSFTAYNVKTKRKETMSNPRLVTKTNHGRTTNLLTATGKDGTSLWRIISKDQAAAFKGHKASPTKRRSSSSKRRSSSPKRRTTRRTRKRSSSPRKRRSSSPRKRSHKKRSTKKRGTRKRRSSAKKFSFF